MVGAAARQPEWPYDASLETGARTLAGTPVDAAPLVLAFATPQAVAKSLEMVTTTTTGGEVGSTPPAVPTVVARLGLGPTDDEQTADLRQERTAVRVGAGAPALQDVVPFSLVECDRQTCLDASLVQKGRAFDFAKERLSSFDSIGL